MDRTTAGASRKRLASPRTWSNRSNWTLCIRCSTTFSHQTPSDPAITPNREGLNVSDAEGVTSALQRPDDLLGQLLIADVHSARTLAADPCDEGCETGID